MIFSKQREKEKAYPCANCQKKIQLLESGQYAFLDHSKTLVFSDVITIEILLKYSHAVRDFWFVKLIISLRILNWRGFTFSVTYQHFFQLFSVVSCYVLCNMWWHEHACMPRHAERDMYHGIWAYFMSSTIALR